MNCRHKDLEYLIAEGNAWNGRNSEASILPLSNGRLLLAWSYWDSGSGHDHAPAEIRGKISTDLGVTWSDSFLLQGRGHYFAVEDPSLVRLPSGRIGLAFFARLGEVHGTTHDCLYQSVFSFFRVSEDEGRSWSDPTIINPVGQNRLYVHWDRFRVSTSGRVLITAMALWCNPLADDPQRQSRSCVMSFCTDDEGKTWRQSNALFVESCCNYEEGSEACAEQLADGTWLMTIRNSSGRAFFARSTDDGATWSKPQPSPLPSSASPIMIRRFPDSDDLLAIWNQVSKREILAGHPRHRLSCAISSNGGNTWTHHKNLESNDTCTVVEPESIEGPLIRDAAIKPHTLLKSEETQYQLTGTKYSNCSYASLVFHEGLAFITYDVGARGIAASLKLRRMPIECFYTEKSKGETDGT